MSIGKKKVSVHDKLTLQYLHPVILFVTAVRLLLLLCERRRQSGDGIGILGSLNGRLDNRLLCNLTPGNRCRSCQAENHNSHTESPCRFLKEISRLAYSHRLAGGCEVGGEASSLGVLYKHHHDYQDTGQNHQDRNKYINTHCCTILLTLQSFQYGLQSKHFFPDIAMRVSDKY